MKTSKEWVNELYEAFMDGSMFHDERFEPVVKAIRRDALEEAATIAKRLFDGKQPADMINAGKVIAASAIYDAIRALIGKVQP